MSGIVGLWHLDGRPADPAIVESLAATIAHRGADDYGIWSAGAACLACHLHRVTPESVAEHQPAATDDGDVLLFDGRLDDRDDLLASLADPPPRDAPDSTLVLAAWREWGQPFLDRLRGDFALALLDTRAQRLILARDPVGCRPLYHWSDGKTVIFASEVKAIAAHPDVHATPNADLLADFVLLDRLPYDDEGKTFFDGIHAIRPGWWLRIAPHRTRSGRFWDFDPLARTRYPSYAAYADRLRELLTVAVKRRLRSRSPVAVAVSGGLDSSIALCIADDLCKNGDTGVSLLPLSYTDADEATSEEHRFLSLLEDARGLRVQRLALGAPGAFEDLVNAAWHAEWPRLDDGWFAQRPMLRSARAQGARVLLTGLWSDQFLFATGYLTDLFRLFAWREIARHLHEYPRWFVDAEPHYFRRRFRRDLVPGLLPHTLRAWLRPLRRAIAKTPRMPPFAARAWRARVNRRRPAVDRPPCGTAHARDIYQAVRSQAHRQQFEADEKLAASCSLDTVSPFLDRDVIAFLMSIPGEVQTRGGVPRALLRDAMRGIVPDPILARRWRDDRRASPKRRDRRLAYRSAAMPAQACAALGFVSRPDDIDADALDFIGLEVWSRTFFSGKLAPPQLG